MFENVGQKIKNVAKIAFVAGIILSVIKALPYMTDDIIFEDFWYMAFLTIILGSVLAWIVSLIVYGFGELIVKVNAIERGTRTDTNKSMTQVQAEDERIAKLEHLRADGLITEEEFINVLNK